MNTKQFFSVSRLTLLALTCMLTLSFAACGGDDDDGLSAETTQVEFEYKDFYRYSQKAYCMFDYAGNKYVGVDTIATSNCLQNLRNGKHQLVWIKGLDSNNNTQGVHYDPRKKTITTYNEYGYVSDEIRYCTRDLEVSQYTAPFQIACTEHVTCGLVMYVTDSPKDLGEIGNGWSGKLTGLPFVKAVSLTGGDYELDSKGYDIGVLIHYGPTHDDVDVSVDTPQMLCPLAGIDNIQLRAEIYDDKRHPVTTVSLPSFSLQRGKITELTGPLFSGTTADWRVSMYSLP